MKKRLLFLTFFVASLFGMAGAMEQWNDSTCRKQATKFEDLPLNEFSYVLLFLTNNEIATKIACLNKNYNETFNKKLNKSKYFGNRYWVFKVTRNQEFIKDNKFNPEFIKFTKKFKKIAMKFSKKNLVGNGSFSSDDQKTFKSASFYDFKNLVAITVDRFPVSKEIIETIGNLTQLEEIKFMGFDEHTRRLTKCKSYVFENSEFFDLSKFPKLKSLFISVTNDARLTEEHIDQINNLELEQFGLYCFSYNTEDDDYRIPTGLELSPEKLKNIKKLTIIENHDYVIPRTIANSAIKNISQFTKLRSLCLYKVDTSHINFENLKRLTFLRMEYGSVSEKQWRNICNLPKLTILYLSKIKNLKEPSFDEGLSNLKILALMCNCSTKQAEDIGKLSKIEKLMLFGLTINANLFPFEKMKSLKEIIGDTWGDPMPDEQRNKLQKKGVVVEWIINGKKDRFGLPIGSTIAKEEHDYYMQSHKYAKPKFTACHIDNKSVTGSNYLPLEGHANTKILSIKFNPARELTKQQIAQIENLKNLRKIALVGVKNATKISFEKISWLETIIANNCDHLSKNRHSNIDNALHIHYKRNFTIRWYNEKN